MSEFCNHGAGFLYKLFWWASSLNGGGTTSETDGLDIEKLMGRGIEK